jgi:hypothetical protein
MNLLIERATLKDYPEIYKLVLSEYKRVGYISRRRSKTFCHNAALDRSPLTTTLICKNQDELAGTISVTIDSEAGLPSDKSFGEVTGRLRRNCDGPLSGVWRFVTRRNASPINLSCSLLNGAISILKQNQAKYVLVCIHPHHENFYIKHFNLSVIARGGEATFNQPAVLLFGKVSCLRSLRQRLIL